MNKIITTRLWPCVGRHKLGMLFIGAFLLISSNLFAQERMVSGKISDADTGESMPGATIVIKGQTAGTITDVDGNYSLSVGNDAVLLISFVGYKTKEITVGNQSVIDVSLEIDITQLSEVVVVGYGTQESKDVTGVVSTVNAKDFNKGAIASADNLIAGKVAGVSITPSTEPGGSPNIVIRGVTSLNAGAQPLIVVDGVTLDNTGYGGGRNGLNFINPSDIESMTILKDASAAAIYGARAAAGVILITTKSGKSGVPKISYDGYYSYSRPKVDYGFLSPSNFRAVVANKAPQVLPLLGNSNTVWVDEVVQPISGQSHNVSFSGGTDKSTFSVSLNHQVNNGVVKYSKNEVTRANVKVTTKMLNDDLTVSVQQRSALSKDNFGSVSGAVFTFDPTQPIYDSANEDYGGYWEWKQGLAPANPVSTLEQVKNIGETRRNFTALNAEYKIPYIKGLALNVIGSADFRDGKSQQFTPTTYLSGTSNLGFISEGAHKAYTYNFEPYISFKKEIEKIETNFEILAGYSYQETYSESFGIFGDDLTTNVYGWNNPAVIGNLKPWEINAVENQLQAVYGRVNISLKDRYLLTSSIRYDGSTRFGSGNRYGVFPSVALGWRLLEEDFMSFLTQTFSNLKLRVGWGQLGNQAIGDYRYEKFYFSSTNDARYQFGNTFYNLLRPTGVDPDIKWETTTTTNIGLDFGLLDNRLTGTLDYYNKVTTDLLATVAPPAFTNVSDVVTTNIAEMYNKGIELGLNYVVYDRQKFDWDISFNAAWNKNEITKLDRGGADSPGLPTGGISGDVGQTIKIWKVGEAYDAFYTYIRDPNGVSSSGVKYQDVNNDGQINEDDLQIVGKPAPDVILGFTSSMTYGNFGLDFTLRSNLGNEVYNNTASANGYYSQIFQGGIRNNIHESALETNYNSRQLHSDYYVENASFLRMDNITLSYNYNKLKFLNARIYGTVHNLFTLSGYSGPNPEISGGIDNAGYPMATTYIVGVSLNF
ncbi:MAG TPA: SusC/RagA family TonB-linked outer membrane protein [Fulvivirga sp.]|nr:SusC/RagA family TonB-linked outer membrane protein [Fulvivirga sp.]